MIRTHGMSNTPLYKAWENMRQRVTNVTVYPRYANVGCDPRWVTFDGFLAHQPAGQPFRSGLVLARFGDLGDYTPENARWLTRAENRAEQRCPPPKTHCSHGHEYTVENTAISTDGRRRCRACAQRRNQAYRARLSNVG